MRFSVVIPLYDKGPFVLAAVRSVLNQTLPAHEIIVVDDGSSDDGLSLVEAIKDPRVVLVRQPNAGVSAARNRGVANATGDWVSFLDADDWHHPEFLHALQKAHLSHPEADLLATNFFEVAATWDNETPGGLSVSASAEQVERVECLRTRWMRSAPFFTSSVAIRASKLKGLDPCFVEGESFGEDLDLWFRISDSSQVVVVNAPLVAYRRLRGSLSASHQSFVLPPFLIRMQERALRGELQPQHRSAALWFVGQQAVTQARTALAAGQRRAALYSLWQGRDVVLTLRWQLTLLMALVLPAKATDRFQRWRVQRSSN